MPLQLDQTPITICNSALAKLGSRFISSFDEETKEARLCREQYQKIKRALLYEHPWSFARKRVKLVLSGDVPIYEYKYAFIIPADSLRIIATSLDEEPDDAGEPPRFKIEADRLVTNESNVSIVYISGTVDETLFTAGFSELLTKKLSMDLCYALVSDIELFSMLRKDFINYSQMMRSFNAQENRPDTRLGYNGAGSYIASRY